MEIHLAADHAGFELKEKVKAHLKELGYRVFDEGAFELDTDDDFPDYVGIVAKQVAGNPDGGTRGIVFGGSGQGEAMAANRYKGVRAVVYYGGSEEIVRLSRQHNDSNVLSVGARFVSEDEAKRMIGLWLKTERSEEPKYGRRNRKLDGELAATPEF